MKSWWFSLDVCSHNPLVAGLSPGSPPVKQTLFSNGGGLSFSSFELVAQMHLQMIREAGLLAKDIDR